MNGPGKYDNMATLVRDTTEAQAVLVIVIGGNLGSGFSVQVMAGLPLGVPEFASMLRDVAAQIEKAER